MAEAYHETQHLVPVIQKKTIPQKEGSTTFNGSHLQFQELKDCQGISTAKISTCTRKLSIGYYAASFNHFPHLIIFLIFLNLPTWQSEAYAVET